MMLLQQSTPAVDIIVKLLIVEDDPAMRALIKRIVGSVADAVYECDDGHEAVAAYAAHRPDWVFMDIKMKNLDGLDATREITAAWPGARIVIVTGYNDASLREAARQAGARGYLLKDNLTELLRLLKDTRE